jgi:hypothetical protein
MYGIVLPGVDDGLRCGKVTPLREAWRLKDEVVFYGLRAAMTL